MTLILKFFLITPCFCLFFGFSSNVEAERLKKVEAERKANLDKAFEKQRQREIELEEKSRREREELLRGTNAPPARLAEPTVTPVGTTAPAAAAAAAGAPAAPYVPKWKRQTTEVSGPSAPTSSETDRRSNRGPPPGDDHWGSNRGAAQNTDRWTSNRERSGPPAEGGDRWGSGPRGSDDRRSTFGSSRPRPTQR